MNTRTLQHDYVGKLGTCSLALVTMPFVANLLADDMGPRQTYFDHHVSWSLALIATPAVFHFLVQFAIHQGMRRSVENRLVRLAGLICTFAVAFGAGLTEVAVADILFLACFP